MPSFLKTHRIDIVICICLAALVFAAFGGAIRFGFIKFDDYARIASNLQVQKGLNAESLKWAMTTGHEGDYNPIAWISHIVDWQLYGSNARMHHLTSVIIHALNAVFLFLVLYYMTGCRWQSAVVALLFAVHPLRAESVAWISARKDVLCAMFWILTLAVYTAYSRKRSAGRHMLVLAMLLLAMLSRPMAITLPFLLLLLDFWPLTRKDTAIPDLIAEKIPMLAIALLVSVASYNATRDVVGVYSLEQITAGMRLSNSLVSYIRYIGKFAWPVNLTAFYPYPQATQIAAAAVSAIVLLLTTAAALLSAKRAPYVTVGWLWYLGTLLPVIGLVQTGIQAMADRYTYIPQIGLLIALVWLASGTMRRLQAWSPTAAALLIIVPALFLAYLAHEQTSYWKSGTELFTHTIAHTGPNYAAQNLLGASLDQEGKPLEAIKHYRASLEIKGTFPDPHYNWGNSLIKLGLIDEAIEHFHAALLLKESADAYRGLAAALNMNGDYGEAEGYCRLALELNPNSDAIRGTLGAILLNQGRFTEAIEHYRRAIAVNPANYIAYHGAALCVMRQGRPAESVSLFEKAISIEPRFAQAYYNMGLALEQSARKQDALSAFRQGLSIAVSSGNDNLAQAFYRKIQLISPQPRTSPRT